MNNSVRESREECPHCGARPRPDRYENHVDACAADPNPFDIGWRDALGFVGVLILFGFAKLSQWTAKQVRS